MKPVFITAIGTDAGKTHVACSLVRAMAERGAPLLALKPLMTGFDPAKLEASDAGRLLTAAGVEATDAAVRDICFWSSPEWSAPNLAARNAGQTLDHAEVLAWLRARLAAAAGPALVEGAGGVMSPLTDGATNIDLMADLGGPVILVACNYLGAVSHTLTACESLERRGLGPAAIVVSQPWPNAGPPAPFVEELRRRLAPPILVAPFSKTADDAVGAALASLIWP
jgi:dethiobiotin synthetase